MSMNCLSDGFCSSLSFLWVTKLFWQMIELRGSKVFCLGQKTKEVEVALSLTTYWRTSQFTVEVTLLWCPEPAFIPCQIKVCLLVAASLCYSFNCERVHEQKMFKWVEFCCGIMSGFKRRPASRHHGDHLLLTVLPNWEKGSSLL